MYGKEVPQEPPIYPQGPTTPGPMPGYPPTGSSGHRHTNSTSSQTSQGSRSSKRDNYGHNPAVESAVTRLLVAIKQLLEALTQWSTGRMTETEVSDVYVRLGNDFNAAVAAFGQFNIDMSELMSVPDDLRSILETCLAEDATPAVLEIYLPDVRKIITNLLQGLRSKQSVYRRTVSERSRQSTSSSQGDSPRTRDSRTSRSGHDRTRSTPRERDSRQSSSSRRKDSMSDKQVRAVDPGEDPEWVGGFAPPPVTLPSAPNERTQSSGHSVRRHKSGGSPGYPPNRQDLLPPPVEEEEAFTPPTIPPVETPTLVSSQAPPNLIRYSLSDRPVPLSPPVVSQDTNPPFVLDVASPPVDSTFTSTDYDQHMSTDTARPASPVAAEQDLEPSRDHMRAPAMESSLAALKKSDALERRASKRFSTYTFSKMTGTRDKGPSALDKLVGGEERRRNRRSAAFGGNLTPGDLESLAEENESSSKDVRRVDSGRGNRSDSSSSSSRRPVRTYSPGNEPPPVPAIPESATFTTNSRHPYEIGPTPLETISTLAPPTSADRLPSEPSTPGLQTITVFLKAGLQVKKVTLDKDGLSIPSLRLQFTEKFSYNPGMDNFPAIYINDTTSHIQYELEDMDEIRDKSLLSLNIEPLDQIKQHIDLQISTLSQDIKDLKSTVGSARRQSLTPQAPMMAITQAPAARPSDGQFANVARRVAARLSRIHMEEGTPRPMRMNSDETPRRSQSPQPLGPMLPQLTGSSAGILDVTSSRIVSDLKMQFDEVQNLRRDLGVMRQLYSDFMNQTKESLSTLRTQTATVRQLATTRVGGARAYIDSGKANLDTRSQNVLTKVEELQDTVETLKHDVLKRHISPKPTLMRTLKADIEGTAKELESLTEHIQTVKPMWKKTWEEELQNIVEEQQFLGHQEEFMDDLLEDHKALSEVYGHIEKVISIRGTTGSTRSRTPFRPPPMEAGHNGLSTVMLEIRGAAVDPERRLKAIAANQKNREKELASRSDEFQAELNGFVSGKKLKMTGGAEEVERMRQKRNDIALKQMFNTGSSASVPQGDPSPPLSPSSLKS